MRISDLVYYGVPPDIVRLWEREGTRDLLPLQELAIKRHDLFGAGNLLLQAPTSSGKTFVGEMAAIQTALRGKKVIYLVPLKALAEEKYLEFQEKYDPYGLKVIVSTRDRRDFDADLEAGDFSLAVVVYEKLAQLLVRRPERLEEIRLIIADELEILSDPDRGAAIELLLTRILQSECRLIGLSAVIGDASGLAEWLKAEPVVYERRPVELRYGVLHDGVFKYRTYNEFTEAEEKLVQVHSDSAWEVLVDNLCAFVEAGEPCLVFVKARREARRGAELLADRLREPAAEYAIEALRGMEASHCRDSLLNTLNSGVAFHSADLSPQERRVVEKAFRDGEVKALVATSTLAVGLNMPAQNVFISAEKWRYDSRFGMPWKAPILRSEYENMGGRAGRYGSDKPFGRSILIAPTPFDFETLWRRYIDGQREQIEPQLDKGSLEDHVVRLVAARACRTEAELLEFFESTLTGKWVWQAFYTREECAFKVRAAVDRALESELLIRDADDNLEATPFGQAVAAKGVTSATARELRHWSKHSARREWSPIDLILAAAVTPDGRMVQVTLTAQEYEHAGYVDTLKALTALEDISADVPLNRFRNCNLMPFFDEVRSIKVALFLNEWIEHASRYDLELRYHVMTGQILAAADQVAWLIDATAAIAAAFGAADAFVEAVRTLSGRVQYGLRQEALALATLLTPPLDRNILLALAADGLHTVEAVAEAPLAVLAQWMDEEQARTLQEWARLRAPASEATAEAEAPPRKAGSPVLIVDDRHPGEIVLDGMPIRLQDKQYRLLSALAAAPGECVPYEQIYAAVWGDTVVEPNQMHFQKRQLLNRIASVLPDREELVQTIPKRGFVLDLRPSEVLFKTRPASSAA
jgi:helicase